MNKRIQIIVACHKPYWRSEEPMYRYIEVGTALRRRPMDGFLHDNTGSHISEKNESFCELTGLYWAWKNLVTGIWPGAPATGLTCSSCAGT